MATAFQKYIVLTFGYEELVGIAEGGGIPRIEKELKNYNLYAILEVCAKISVTLLSDGFTNPLAQAKLLAGIFPDHAQRLRYYEIAQAKANGLPWAIFAHQSLLTLVKLALMHCPRDKGSDISPDNIEKVGYWLLIINEELFGDESGKRIAMPTMGHDRERLRAALARYQFFNGTQRLAYKIGRYKWFVEYFRKNKPHGINLDELFEKATDSSLHDYLTVCGALLVKWVNLSNKQINIMSDWVTCKETYFKNTKIDKSKIDKVLGSIMMTPDEYEGKYTESLGIIGGKDFLYYNYMPFIWNPLITMPQTKCFVCPSSEFLYDKMTDGIYREIETYMRRLSEQEGASKDEQKKHKIQRQTFSIAWGHVFEEYVSESLQRTFGQQFHKSPKDSKGVEIIDGLIESNTFAFFVETKNRHWSYKAMITGDRVAMEDTLQHLFAKKGLQQIATAIKRATKKEVNLPIEIKNKWIIPLLIVSETMPQDAYNRRLYETVAFSAGAIINSRQVLPFVLLTVEEVEMLEAFAENKGAEKAVEILSAYCMLYTKRNEEGFVPDAISFKNFLFYRGFEDPKSVSNNTMLQKLFDDVFDEISMDAFGKKLWKRGGKKIQR